MINSAYDKTMENLRKRINVRLLNNDKDFLKCTGRPTHITYKIFDKNFAAIHRKKKKSFNAQQTHLCWVYCSRIKQMVDL